MKKEIFSTVIYNTQVANDTYEIKLDATVGLDFTSGQFVNVKINRADLLLRRPISIYRYEKKSGHITLIYKVVGKGTKELAKLIPNDTVSLLGPLGNGISINDKDKKVFLLGGGIGCAPLMSIIDSDDKKTYTTFLGFDTKASIYCYDEFKEKSKNLYITTDDGSFGDSGFITEKLKSILQSETPDIIFACGPILMLKSYISVLDGHNVKAYVSIEERMGCGMGGCAVCACKTTSGVKKACVDGPVFDIDEVIL